MATIKSTAWSPFKIGNLVIKYSKANKSWQVWKKNNLITDYKLKASARNYAERINRENI